MEAETIPLNMRGVTQAYEIDPLPAEHRIMKSFLLGEPALFLLSQTGLYSLSLAPVKTKVTL